MPAQNAPPILADPGSNDHQHTPAGDYRPGVTTGAAADGVGTVTTEFGSGISVDGEGEGGGDGEVNGAGTRGAGDVG